MFGPPLAMLVLTQAPAPPAAAPVSARRQADLKKRNESRETRRAQAGEARAKALGPRCPPEAPGEPDGGAQRALMQQNQALQGMTSAAQQQANVAADQYRLSSQVAGAPQIFVPGQGMVPDPYGIAPPAYTNSNRGPGGGTAPMLPLEPSGR